MSRQRVLVTSAEILDRTGRFQGFTLDVERYLSAIFSSEAAFFIDRDLAEHDPNYKQLIPYVVLRFGDVVFTYARGAASTEERLVAKRSIGVGGHIEPEDIGIEGVGRAAYVSGAKREVSEEVLLDTTYTERVVAIINDDSNAVGRVHLGIVHLWDLARPAVTPLESKIVSAGFVGIDELRRVRHSLESWSAIALAVLEQMRNERA